MFKFEWLSRLLLMCVCLSAANLYAADWYLAANGNDASDCSDKETPCKNIHPLVQRAEFASGDKILLKTGTYDLLGSTNGWGGPLDKAFEVYGGYNADYTERVVDASKTIITDSRTSGNARLFALNIGHQKPVIFDGVQISDFKQAASATDDGLIMTHVNGAWLKLNNVIIQGNTMRSTAAIGMLVADDLLEISNSSVSGNEATTGNAIIRLGTGSRAIIRDSIIDNNTVSAAGGLHVTNAIADLYSVTFYNNQAANAAAIYAEGANAKVNCHHCSIVKNTASQVLRVILNATVSFKNSVVANEAGTLLSTASGGSVVDLGFNAFGINGSAAGIPTPLHATSFINVEANLTDIFAADIDYNGGLIKSLKLSSKHSNLIDKIPNDRPELLTGTAPGTPFTSLADAHNALTAFAHYKKRTYFFSIGSSAFSTIVDNDGWVLIAGGNKFQASGAYTETQNLAEKSDAILDRTILAEQGFDFDEVRITGRAVVGGRAVTLDARSSNSNVINAVKNFTMLPNNFNTSSYGRGGWYAYEGAERVLSNSPLGDTLTGAPNGGVTADLNVIIFDTPGKTSGLRWTPGANGHLETLEWPSQSAPPRTADLNLWVRSSNAYCGGIVKTDQRGMPRPDYVNLNDPNQYGDVRDCDIGAFEWNDGYRLDCFDEDGERPENSLTKTDISFCIKDISQITPKGIIDNMGYTHPLVLIFLLSLLASGLLRLKAAKPHTGK